jgi:hypothetical protein
VGSGVLVGLWARGKLGGGGVRRWGCTPWVSRKFECLLARVAAHAHRVRSASNGTDEGGVRLQLLQAKPDLPVLVRLHLTVTSPAKSLAPRGFAAT